MRELRDEPIIGSCLGISEDARALDGVEAACVDLIITSPPYLGAQKYVRACSLSLTWLEMCTASELREVEDLNIGREHYSKSCYHQPLLTGLHEADELLAGVRLKNPLRAHIAAQYLHEMRAAVSEMHRVLKPSGFLVLVLGASTVCGARFDTPRFILRWAEQFGFRLAAHLTDRIRSRALMTKRHHTAGQIDEESILILAKG